MPFAIYNQTHDSLLFWPGKGTGSNSVISVAPLSESPPFSPKRTLFGTSLWVARRPQDAGSKEATDLVAGASWVTMKLSMAPGRTWMRVKVQGEFPCIIYRNRISRKHSVLIVLPHRDTSRFLATIADSMPLSSLMLPGTHETMSFYGWPISQCQLKPLDVQLRAGIRVVDLRLSVVDGQLFAYHGIFPEVTPFADMLVTLHNFLTSPTTKSETVVVSIKEEDNNTHIFPGLVYDAITASPGGQQMWFLEDRIPNLGEVRGKAVMFSRFGSDTGNGIHPTTWPDSDKNGFQWECSGTLVRTEDWYDIKSFTYISEKASLATELLIPPTDSPNPTLSISFASASSFPLALPPVIALGFGWPNWGLGFKGVNELVGEWLLNQLQHGTAAQIRGWLLIDYYEEPVVAGLVPLLIECNFRGKGAGEEGL